MEHIASGPQLTIGKLLGGWGLPLRKVQACCREAEPPSEYVNLVPASTTDEFREGIRAPWKRLKHGGEQLLNTRNVAAKFKVDEEHVAR